MVSGWSDGTVRSWDASSGEIVRELQECEGNVYSFALSANGGHAVSYSGDGTVRVWDASSGESLRVLRVNKDRMLASDVLSVAVSADGGRVALASEDGAVRVWDASSGESVRELWAHEGPAICVALSADGGRVLFGSYDSTMRCFSLSSEGAGAATCDWVAANFSPHGIPSYAIWCPGRGGESDVLISASGDAWRFLSWDVEDPTEPGGWRRVPLQGYE